MPANVSFMYGVSPPFPNKGKFLPLQNPTFYSPASIQSEMSFSRVPSMELKNPKSCLKLTQREPRVISECINPKEDQDQTEVDAISDRCDEDSRKIKKRKRVTFADRNGGVLTLIKYLTESTNEPPRSFTSENFLIDLMENMKIKPAESSTDTSAKLVLKFDQPAADYVKFKSRVEKLNVSLENVAVKSISNVHGTVKVRNIAYEKTVTLRITFDDWRTITEIPCEYANNAYDGGVFDTFQFTIDIPFTSNQVQFCVRYQCNANEFWDNNDGQNYIILRTNNYIKSSPIAIPKKYSWSQPKSYPSTYCELPSPQERTWLPLDKQTPFY